MEMQLSEAEKVFIVHGVQSNLRNDGRRNDDFRPIFIETDIVKNASGSARVKVGSTDVLVGIKAEIDIPSPSNPDHGRMQFFVDCSANASPDFEGRGGDEFAQEISDSLKSAYDNHKTREIVKKLCLVQGQICWLLYVDVVVLECSGGNVFDCVSFAIKCALFDLKLPNSIISYNENGKADVDLTDDCFDFWRLDVQKTPIFVTVGKIGTGVVVDMSAEEEICRKSALIVGIFGTNVDESSVTLVRQTGGGGSLDPDSVAEMIQAAVKTGCRLNEQLTEKLKTEEKSERSNVRGFLL